MYKLLLTIILIVLLFVEYQKYDHFQQQQLKQEQALLNYQQEKKALDKARATNELESLIQFIHQYPESVWMNTAVYYRDRLIMQKAIDSRQANNLTQFIQNYPDSSWKNHAQHQLTRLNTELEAEEARRQAEIKRKQTELTTRKIADTDSKKIYPITKTKKPKNDDPNARVQRALSIYKKANEQKQKEAAQKKKQQQQTAELTRRCNKTKDQLKQFKTRTRWYNLDEQGNRVYVDKAIVEQRKKDMQANYERYCQ